VPSDSDSSDDSDDDEDRESTTSADTDVEEDDGAVISQACGAASVATLSRTPNALGVETYAAVALKEVDAASSSSSSDSDDELEEGEIPETDPYMTCVAVDGYEAVLDEEQ
jgi:hypothetical protein